MAMTIEELDLESAELIPAREVMCGVSHHGRSGGSFWFNNQENSNVNQQYGLVNIGDILNPQVNL